MGNYSKKRSTLAVTIETDDATLAEPTTDTDGGDITGWRTPDGFAPRDAVVIVKPGVSAGGTVTIVAPVLRGYDIDDAKWRDIGKLNSGDDIVVTATLEWEARVFDVGMFERLALAGTPDDNATVVVKPVEDADR